MSCKIENLTVDATIHGDVIEVPTFKGGTEYVTGQFREPYVDAIFCSEHGYLFEDSHTEDINEVVKKHLEENE